MPLYYSQLIKLTLNHLAAFTWYETTDFYQFLKILRIGSPEIISKMAEHLTEKFHEFYFEAKVDISYWLVQSNVPAAAFE